MSEAVAVKARHPKGLYVLFLTEMWERFAYYLLAGILLLYLRDSQTGGKGMTAQGRCRYYRHLSRPYLASDVYRRDDRRPVFRLCQIGVYRRRVPCRWLFRADPPRRYSHVYLPRPDRHRQRFFKPNISTLLGNIYNRTDLKPLKDNAYNIFYMGINTGSLLCNFASRIFTQ